MMPFQPGQSGNPSGYKGERYGNRHQRHRELFDKMKELGHDNALMFLSETLSNKNLDIDTRVQAATSLAPFGFPKLQSVPVPRYIEHPFELPEVTTVQEAQQVIAKIAVLYAAGKLDSQSAVELTTMLQALIHSKEAAEIDERLSTLEEVNGLPPRKVVVTGGLPRLPGHEDLIMPGDEAKEPEQVLPPASEDPGPQEPQP
jgi:hypothetical protein